MKEINQDDTKKDKGNHNICTDCAQYCHPSKSLNSEILDIYSCTIIADCSSADSLLFLNLENLRGKIYLGLGRFRGIDT